MQLGEFFGLLENADDKGKWIIIDKWCVLKLILSDLLRNLFVYKYYNG